jgi:hypothetical protein
MSQPALTFAAVSDDSLDAYKRTVNGILASLGLPEDTTTSEAKWASDHAAYLAGRKKAALAELLDEDDA